MNIVPTQSSKGATTQHKLGVRKSIMGETGLFEICGHPEIREYVRVR